MTHELQWPLGRWVYAVNTKSIITTGISLIGHPAVGKTLQLLFVIRTAYYYKEFIISHSERPCRNQRCNQFFSVRKIRNFAAPAVARRRYMEVP